MLEEEASEIGAKSMVPDADIGTMRADQTKLRQTLFNLLSNACKFIERGVIRLSVEREEQGSVEHVTANRRIGETASDDSGTFNLKNARRRREK
jgi:signal transduction histidine kinase